MRDNENRELTEKEIREKIDVIKRQIYAKEAIIEMLEKKLTADEVRKRLSGRKDLEADFVIDTDKRIAAAQGREERIKKYKAEKEELESRLATITRSYGQDR